MFFLLYLLLWPIALGIPFLLANLLLPRMQVVWVAAAATTTVFALLSPDYWDICDGESLLGGAKVPAVGYFVVAAVATVTVLSWGPRLLDTFWPGDGPDDS